MTQRLHLIANMRYDIARSVLSVIQTVRRLMCVALVVRTHTFTKAGTTVQITMPVS